DPVVIPMGTRQLEKILTYKPPTDPEGERFLVKFKGSSYLHAEWVPRDFIESEFLGKHRLKKFLAQQQQPGMVNQWTDEPFNPAYTQVDRVIDEGELFNAQTGQQEVYVLVKWCNLPYDESTWENIEQIRTMDAEKLDEFHQRRLPPSPDRSHDRPRPPRQAFQQLNESHAFKYGNKLRPYQLEGLNWLLYCWFNRQSCIMADEMGLGKTVQSVSFLNQIHQSHGINGPFLVVAPLSTVPHWEREFRSWTTLNVLVYHGSAASRNLIVDTEYYFKDPQGRVIPHYYKFDVIITTYEMISAGAGHLKSIPWRAGVFDEAHRLKNKASKVLEFLNDYSFEHRLLLTGTPLQNSMHELFSLLNFLQPDRFDDEAAFLTDYGSLKSKEEVDRIQALLKPLMLRRFKEDVEKSIPVKEETVVEVELTAYQKKFYRAILEKNFTWLKNGAKGSGAGPSLMNIVVELRKCCMHPFLITGAEERIAKEVQPQTTEAYLNMMIESSGKLVLIDKLLRKLKEGNHKVLIFSQMTRCLDVLADYLTARRYGYERIDGSIKGELRQAAIDRFSTDPNSFVFLLCTRAGGVGINLTAADTCVIYDSDWNPQNDLQAQARCHRIGQTKPVKIYRLLTRNTYEKEMFDRAGMKLGLDKAVLQKMDVQSALRSGTGDLADSGRGPSSALSKKEVEELLKKGAYGALMDDDGASSKFCDEDIDQILERRTTIIKHDNNEPGSIFSKASFTTASNEDDVDINDPEFWDKWAKKADVKLDEGVMANPLIIQEPRQRRAAMRYNENPRSNPPSASNSDSEDDAEYGKRRTNQVKPWTQAEKTRLERKIMIWGYGKWDELAAYLPRRQQADLHAIVRCMVIYALQLADIKNSEDQELLRDIKAITEAAGDPITDAELVSGLKNIRQIPYPNANKRQITEYRSFLIDSSPDYLDHMKKKGRNLLLRIQLMYIIRDKIVPADWMEAKRMIIPKITGSQPADWWGTGEDRDLLLGIYKYGYQQYHRLLTDPELHFHRFNFANAPVQDDDD
ncbi:SNF2 family N-terminal domain-containing protein, partial [Dimargaris cristalligena]